MTRRRIYIGANVAIFVIMAGIFVNSMSAASQGIAPSKRWNALLVPLLVVCFGTSLATDNLPKRSRYWAARVVAYAGLTVYTVFVWTALVGPLSWPASTVITFLCVGGILTGAIVKPPGKRNGHP